MLTDYWWKRSIAACAMPAPFSSRNDREIGTEEVDVIEPAVREAQARQIAAEGPFPSDTLYLRMRDRRFDCAVSMYYDQGQIAIKLLGFDRGVTVLGGLPVPIATPAHGTAYDIAGTNTARLDVERRADKAEQSRPRR